MNDVSVPSAEPTEAAAATRFDDPLTYAEAQLAFADVALTLAVCVQRAGGSLMVNDADVAALDRLSLRRDRIGTVSLYRLVRMADGDDRKTGLFYAPSAPQVPAQAGISASPVSR